MVNVHVQARAAPALGTHHPTADRAMCQLSKSLQMETKLAGTCYGKQSGGVHQEAAAVLAKELVDLGQLV